MRFKLVQGLADSALKARLIEEGEEASLAATMALAREEERDINDYELAKMEYQEDEDMKEVVEPSPKQVKIVWGSHSKCQFQCDLCGFQRTQQE